jgi:AcrR family transcriptional regulator
VEASPRGRSGARHERSRVSTDRAPRSTRARQPRADRTRQALLDAASSLWREKGYDAVAVSEICARAGVSKGTFFYHFPAKEHLLVDLVAADGTEAVAAAVDTRLAAGASLLDVLATAVAVLADAQRCTPRDLVSRATMEVLRGSGRTRPLTEDGHPELRDVYARVYAEAIAQGELPATFHPAELGAVTNWTLLQGTLFWSLGVVGRLSLEETLWRRVQLVVHGARLGRVEPWRAPTARTPVPSSPPV